MPVCFPVDLYFRESSMKYPIPRFFRLAPLGVVLLISPPTLAGWQDYLDKAREVADTALGASSDHGASLGDLTQEEIAGGLKEALGKGVERAVRSLGSVDGYLENARVHIPLPGQLDAIKAGLKQVGQEKLADDFEISMNRAAETAVREAAPVFGKAITAMRFEDARALLDGGDTAATEYLRRTAGDELAERMRPLVQEATDNAEVTGYYKKMVTVGKDYAGGLGGGLGGGLDGSLGGWVGKLGSMFDAENMDLDRYITDKAMEGLYEVLAEQERQIRNNPGEWTTNALRKVFGSLSD